MAYEKPGRLSGGLGSFSELVNTIPVGPETKEEIIERLTRDRDMSKIKVTPAIPDVNPFDPKHRKRVAIYCRVSTDNLAQTPSFITQQQYYLKYVRKRPEYRMVAIYKDEGLSATSIQKRAGLVRLLRDAKAGKFDLIIVKNLSRLSRNLMDCMRIIFMLRMLPKPVGILFENEKLYTLNRENDFTLQILALIAQEESHKKSEAVTNSQRQRYEQGNFLIYDILGYDRVGVNKIAVNNEEAQTVRLIFMMYMAGYDPSEIADTLIRLGRKKHTHHYRDGRVKEGTIDWTGDSVINILKNEKRCGEVLAQKTVTPNYLDHKAVKNTGQAPQYYAVDQHKAVVDPADFYVVQKMLSANRGGWKHGLQTMGIYEEGVLHGGVSTVPNWYGFGTEDYNRACLKANGIDEKTLDEIGKDTETDNEEQNTSPQPTYTNIPSMVEIDSDDYENFPDEEIQEMPDPAEETQKDNYFSMLTQLRESEYSKRKINKLLFGKHDLTNIEYGRVEFFSMHDKNIITLDHNGILCNRNCFNRMNEDAEEPVKFVEVVYNPLEHLLFIKKAEKETPATISWVKVKNGRFETRRCPIKGIAKTIYENMGWNRDYKYRVVGRAQREGDETLLVFFLDYTIKIVPVKTQRQMNAAAGKLSKKKSKRFVDGYLPDDIILPNFDDFDFGGNALDNQFGAESKSDAIYYDEQTSKDESQLTLEDLGDDKYSPERIRRLMQRGLSPEGGWSYLKGMASVHKNSFSIFQEDWADNFGNNVYDGRDAQLRIYLDNREKGISKPVPYGWTVGLELPTKETVEASISELAASS